LDVELTLSQKFKTIELPLVFPLSKKLGDSQLLVSILVKHGEMLAKAEQLELAKDKKAIILWASPITASVRSPGLSRKMVFGFLSV
jgi:hypothetical protein